jgi:hypothetical protein
MPEQEKGLTLFVCAEETDDGPGSIDRFLDVYVELSICRPEFREKREFTVEEIKRIHSLRNAEQNYLEEIYSLFGYKDLKAWPGLPHGPYYWIGEGVREKIKEIAERE